MSEKFDFFTLENGLDSSGVTGFPCPVQFESPTNPEYFPFPFPVEVRDSTTLSVNQLCMRIRRFRCETDMQVQAGADTVNFPLDNLVDRAFRTTESHIVLDQASSQHDTNAPYPVTAAGSRLLLFTYFSNVALPDRPIWADGDNWYPQMRLKAEMSVTDGVSGDSAVIELASHESFLSSPATGNLVGEIAGTPVTLHQYSNSTGGASATLSFFRLVPTEYWSWDGTYSTLTGLEL